MQSLRGAGKPPAASVRGQHPSELTLHPILTGPREMQKEGGVGQPVAPNAPPGQALLESQQTASRLHPCIPASRRGPRAAKSRRGHLSGDLAGPSRQSSHVSPAPSKPDGWNLHCRQFWLLHFFFTWDNQSNKRDPFILAPVSSHSTARHPI